MNNVGATLGMNYTGALQAFRDITNSTNERTLIVDNIPLGPVGNNAPVISQQNPRVVAYALILANLNSIPLDWAARMSVGGSHMSFFIVKQLPVFPPAVFLEDSCCGVPWVQLIVPRVLELTYTSEDMATFAIGLGYDRPPFTWDEERRHFLRCELDAIFVHMYGLTRDDLVWILDSPPPSSSFPSLKAKEIAEFGEYRTMRHVLGAYDLLERGIVPNLAVERKNDS